MATKTATSGGPQIEAIDRLEDKIKALVSMVERMKTEQARAADDNQRLTRDVEALRARLSASDGLNTELSSLKEERDIIRTRVGEMLQQLEALNL